MLQYVRMDTSGCGKFGVVSYRFVFNTLIAYNTNKKGVSFLQYILEWYLDIKYKLLHSNKTILSKQYFIILQDYI